MARLEDEEKTRDQLSSLDQRLSNMVFVVQTVRGEHLVKHIPSLSKAVLNALPSPLATRHCAQLWHVMAHSVFKEWSLGMYTAPISPQNSSMIVLKFFLSAQLFSEVSLRTLLSYSASPSPALPKLLSGVEQHISPTPILSNAAHTLSLPLLHTILVKMEGASSELRGSAVATLCKASHSYTHSRGDDAQVDMSVAVCITACYIIITSLQFYYNPHNPVTSPLHHHYITIASSYVYVTITITSPLHFALHCNYILVSLLSVAVVPSG